MERFYGYKHWTLETSPRCFYVGKGLKKRPYERSRNHKWHSVKKRFGLHVDVCVGPMTNEKACAWEIEWIVRENTFSTNHSHDDPNDIGCNFTRGGEGSVGRIRSAEERHRNSVAHRRENLSPETLRKRSVALTGQRRSFDIRKKFSDVQKAYSAEHPDTELTRRHKSEGTKRSWQDPLVRQRRSDAQKGRTMTENRSNSVGIYIDVRSVENSVTNVQHVKRQRYEVA